MHTLSTKMGENGAMESFTTTKTVTALTQSRIKFGKVVYNNTLIVTFAEI